MRLRPHHLLDIITQYGSGTPFKPSDYGHAVHTVAEKVIGDLGVSIEFVVDADDICAPCKHLVDGKCDDVLVGPTLLSGRDPEGPDKSVGPTMKQDYNDDLDRRLFAYLEMTEGDVITFREYLRVVREHLEGIEAVCTHPHEDAARRLENLTAGLERLED